MLRDYLMSGSTSYVNSRAGETKRVWCQQIQAQNLGQRLLEEWVTVCLNTLQVSLFSGFHSTWRSFPSDPNPSALRLHVGVALQLFDRLAV